jgi:hypothetical protein
MNLLQIITRPCQQGDQIGLIFGLWDTLFTLGSLKKITFQKESELLHELTQIESKFSPPIFFWPKFCQFKRA